MAKKLQVAEKLVASVTTNFNKAVKKIDMANDIILANIKVNDDLIKVAENSIAASQNKIELLKAENERLTDNGLKNEELKQRLLQFTKQ